MVGLAGKERNQWVHPGIGKQDGGILLWDQWGGGNDGMPFALEEFQVLFLEFVGFHGIGKKRWFYISLVVSTAWFEGGIPMGRLEERLEDYGSLGKLSPTTWKQYLTDSGNGFGDMPELFRRMNGTSPEIVGPTLDSSGKVTGDLFLTETLRFMDYAGEAQRNLYQQLLDVNQVAAKEYLLTISGSIDRWKKDVKWLNLALGYLREEGEFLRGEAEFMLQENTHGSKNFPDALKRHFPQLFYDIDFTGLSLEGALQKVKLLLEEVEPEEKYLEDYLTNLQQEMPFLFEGSNGK